MMSQKRRKSGKAKLNPVERDDLIILRARLRLEDSNGDYERVARYLLQARGTRLEKMQRLPGLSLPMRHALTRAVQLREEKREKRAEKERRIAQEHEAAERGEQDRRALLAEQYDAHRDSDNLIRWLAGLAPKDRDRLATAEQRRQAIEMRKRCRMSGAVRQSLACTQTELDRWDREGRLPHLYTRLMQYAKLTRCRFWYEQDVDDAIARVPGWRKDWEAAKRARRTKLKKVKG